MHGHGYLELRALAALDLRLLRLLRTRGHTPGVERALIMLARAGENALLWNAIGVGPEGSRRRDDYVRAIEIVLLTLLLNTVVKQTVRRAQPVLEEELPARRCCRGVLSSARVDLLRGRPRARRGGLPAAPLRSGRHRDGALAAYLGVHYERCGRGRLPRRRRGAAHDAVTREITRAIRSVKSIPAACAA